MPNPITITNPTAVDFVESIVNDFLIAGCIEIVRRKDGRIGGFKEARLLLAFFDTGFDGQACREQLAEKGRRLAEQIVNAAIRAGTTQVFVVRRGRPTELTGRDVPGGFGAVGWGMKGGKA